MLPNFVVRMPASNYGQTMPAWNAGSIININVDIDAVEDGDQLYYNQEKNVWVTEKRTKQIFVDPTTGTSFPFMRYDPNEEKLYYKAVHYGTFYSTITQNLIQNNIKRLQYNASSNVLGLGYTGSQITFTQIGTYKIGTSILFRQTNGSGDHAFVAFHKNANLIPNTSSDIFVHGNNASALAYVEIFVDITNVSDTIDVVCYTTSSRVYCPAVASPHPSIGLSPSIITTVQQVA
jgi:hypothetical protein